MKLLTLQPKEYFLVEKHNISLHYTTLQKRTL